MIESLLMKLEELLEAGEQLEIIGPTDIQVTDICYHSAKASPGALFVAVPGLKSDGREYIPEAVKRGASAVLLEGQFFDNLGITQIRIRGVREVLAQLAAKFFVHPSKELYLTGVTGTNGKTTITTLINSLWQNAKIGSGLIGTIAIQFADQMLQASHTTPESRDLQFIFRKMVEASISHVALEVSSHAVSQQRVLAAHFDSCVFTNLTQDHLDYHSSLEDYYLAKEKLFSQHLANSEKKNRLAIICDETPYSQRLKKKIKEQKLNYVSYGLSKNSDIYPLTSAVSLRGIQSEISTPLGVVSVDSPLIGEFNLLNIMAVIAVAQHSGVPRNLIEQGLKKAMGAIGRLERIKDAKGRLFFVDYAHTPDALTNVLKTIRALQPNKMITVFGCGGDRDKSKRPLMGFEVALFTDVAIVTSDNPRTEDPLMIIEDIIPGLNKGGSSPFVGDRGYIIEPDRKKAIEQAVSMAGPDDVVLVAGKGHEDYQIIGQNKIHFSDQEELQRLAMK